MRKGNAVLSVLIMVLFAVHLVWGGLIMAGMTAGGSRVLKMLTHIMLTLIAVHVVIGLVLTADTVRVWRKTGVHYLRRNMLFWVRRVSGLAMMFFVAVHVMIFSGRTVEGVYRLNPFGAIELAAMLLMAASLLVHLSCNITPLRIALGLSDKKNFRMDLLLVVSILLLLAGAAFIVYYIRWQTI